MSARTAAARALIVATGAVVGAAVVVAVNPDRGTRPSLALPAPASSGATGSASSDPGTTSSPDPAPSRTRRSEQPSPSPTRSRQPDPQPTTSSARPEPTTTPDQPSGYRDGTFTGDSVFVNFGDVQVEVTIEGHRIVDIQALALPDHDRRSADISNQAWPYLVQEALAAQSARIAGVGGASYTSYGFAMSLKSALDQAS
jgi:uncharacterized protein with FMN-binding domain